MPDLSALGVGGDHDPGVHARRYEGVAINMRISTKKTEPVGLHHLPEATTILTPASRSLDPLMFGLRVVDHLLRFVRGVTQVQVMGANYCFSHVLITACVFTTALG